MHDPMKVKMRVLILCTTFIPDISHLKKNSQIYTGLHVKYSLFLSHFN